MKKLLVAIAAGVLLVAGCGQSDEDAIMGVVEDYFFAAGSGDGEAACELRTEDSMITGLDGCVKLIESSAASEESFAALDGEDSKINAKYKHFSVERVEISGGSATALLDDDRSEATLKKVDGSWLIDAVSVPGWLH